MSRTAVLTGAGPAGLTAAYELLTRTDIVPVVLEKSETMGGISRTVNYKGNRIDIGGHRFFSKSDRVMKWWLERLPPECFGDAQARQALTRNLGTGDLADPQSTDRVMLLRSRISRIFFKRKFFDYPLSLSASTLHKLGLWNVLRIGASYSRSAVFPQRREDTLEQFLINRFGRVLYRMFFEAYTEKVWGIPCREISSEWGAQRIKGLSVRKAVAHMLTKAMRKNGDVRQKAVETSLIDWFLYPKYGPGQMWEETASQIRSRGGRILTGWTVNGFRHEGGRITAADAVHRSGERRTFPGDFFFSTMPVRELVAALSPAAPPNVQEVAAGLKYRDFITVGLLCGSSVQPPAPNGCMQLKDNWIYIQEPDVLVGRLQIFNNWSPYMVADPQHTWMGLEYFCNEGDSLWRKTDGEMIELAKHEMQKLGIVHSSQVLDGTVIRMEKTYPAYFGTYARFGEIREYLDGFENLFLVGRNGMHKYNNQDHSMLTAMVAVDNIAAGIPGKENLWSINTEQEYHEEKK